MRDRLLSVKLPTWVDPALAYIAVIGEQDDAAWLDSGPDADSGMSYIALAAEVTTQFDLPVWEWLAAQAATVVGDAPTATESSESPGFRLGWIGWCGYEVLGETMGLAVPADSRHPDASWMRVDRAIAFDHGRREVWLIALGSAWAGDLLAWRRSVVRLLDNASGLQSRHDSDPAPSAATALWAHTDERYLEMIGQCQASIVEGDAYQLCLTTQARVPLHPDPVATYLRLRQASPAHHGALVRMGGVSLLSASPEQFLAVSPTGMVRTSPIKGTRPRGSTPDSDALLRRELEQNEKERAENIMIVDLMRNDLGRVCVPGSVEVTSLLAVESYAQVHQLVSTVQGRLAEGRTAMDAVAACFPAGSMTGAPKRAAVEVLLRLEQRPRGIYSGVFGYLGLDGALDLAMVIRSIIIDESGCTVGTGGGITALSNPLEELAEMKLKAAALLAVLGVREAALDTA